jgi:hypothetical protein
MFAAVAGNEPGPLELTAAVSGADGARGG